MSTPILRIKSAPDDQLVNGDQRRLGRFAFRTENVRNPDELVCFAMGQVVVLSAIPALDRDEIDYIALSTYFDWVPHGQTAPHYDVLFSQGYHGNRKMRGVRFVRSEPVQEALPCIAPAGTSQVYIAQPEHRLQWTDNDTTVNTAPDYTLTTSGSGGLGVDGSPVVTINTLRDAASDLLNKMK